jgi:type I restriction enzyme R subunit
MKKALLAPGALGERDPEAEICRDTKGKLDKSRLLALVQAHCEAYLKKEVLPYLRFLLTKLPRRASGLAYHFEDEIELKFYRLQKISEGRIDLSGDKLRPLKGPGDVGTGRDRDKEVPLSELIDVLNERFGTDFNQADQLFFDQIQEEALADHAIHQAARVNTIDDFRLVFDKAFEGLAIDRMEGNLYCEEKD